MSFDRYAAEYFDGQSAVRKEVVIDIDRVREMVVVSDPSGGILGRWPFDDMRRIGDVADGHLHIMRQGDLDEARLIVAHGQAKVIIETLATSLDKKDMTGAVWKKIALWAGGAAAALCLMIFVIVPALAATLAPLISPEREAQIGQSTLRQIEWLMSEEDDDDASWFCSSPDGDAALAKMTNAVLGDYDLPYELNVRAVNHSMINAFALPGAQIVLMNGLLKAADSPEQIAGVLAHEIGHVANRDPVEQALRAGGTAGLLSLILGDATGGTAIAIVGEQLINNSYSRQAETAADSFALDRMDEANLDPAAFAEFFDLLIAEMGDAADMEENLAWASTHPGSKGRAANALAASDDSRTYSDVLTAEEWAALQAICD